MSHANRYSRHLLLKGFGAAAQERLANARVLVIGAGGLSNPMLSYLAAAGIGTIGIIDNDIIELSNLQRQVLFQTDDIGQAKVTVAATRLKAMNPLVEIITYHQRIDSSNALEIIAGYDLVADGSDNFPTRYLVNDACLILNKALVYGSVFRFEGQVSVFNLADDKGDRGPNYRDLFPVPPPPESVLDCSEAGVLGVLPGIIGTMQALEVIKVIAGVGEPLSGKLYHFDGLSMQSQVFKVSKRAAADAITSLTDYESFCNTSPALDVPEISMQDLKNLPGEFTVIDVREPAEYEAFNIGGRLIPIGELPGHADEFAKDAKLVFHCKSGARARKAISIMQELGFSNLRLLRLEME